MARYPTFEDYRKRGNFNEGIKKCDDLLNKNPNDIQLLTTKLQLLFAVEGDAEAVLGQLSSLQPPPIELQEIAAIEDAVENSQRDVFPSLNTVGSSMAKIWDNATKASNSVNHKLDLLSLRFSRAIVDNRLVDAQQALIQLKVLQPKNRVIYMAHAAVTQMLSTSKNDLQSRLALSLARKAVKENFDDDKALDCRVPGQIFALQKSETDLEGIKGRAFGESKQVYNALRTTKAAENNGAPNAQISRYPTPLPRTELLHAEVQSLKEVFTDLLPASTPTLDMLVFAGSAMRLFYTTKTEIPAPRGRDVADACFLSISALVRAFELSQELRYLLLAAFVAENLLQHNPHIHEARLILVYLYMRLGLGSLALRLFDSLNIKEIQHDTVGHALFTRLAVTHPHSTKVKKKETFDPSKRMSHALNVYIRHEEKLAENQASILNHEQTGMLFDLHELRRSLRLSVARRITYLEQRRLARLLNVPAESDVSSMGPKLTANWLETIDNRDFAATFDFGYNVEKALHGDHGALPGRRWILFNLAADTAWCIATGSPPPAKDVEELSTALLDLDRLTLDDSNEPTASELSEAESLAADLIALLLQMLLHAQQDEHDHKSEIEAVWKRLMRLDIDKLNAEPQIFTERIQDFYTYLDIFLVVIKACNFVATKLSESVDRIGEIEEHAKECCRAIQEHATRRIQGINSGEIKAYVLQDESLNDSIDLFGKASVSDFCNSVAVSAKEGWEGITKITLK